MLEFVRLIPRYAVRRGGIHHAPIVVRNVIKTTTGRMVYANLQ
jgi:hypothetical protein